MRASLPRKLWGVLAGIAALAAILAYGALGATPSQGPKSDGFCSSSGAAGPDVLIPTTNFIVVRSLDLPAGSYLTSAKAVFSDAGTERAIAYCFLTDTWPTAPGGDEDQSLASVDPTSNGIGGGTVVSLLGSGSFTSSVTINLRCRNNGAGELRGHNFVISAARVGSLTIQT